MADSEKERIVVDIDGMLQQMENITVKKILSKGTFDSEKDRRNCLNVIDIFNRHGVGAIEAMSIISEIAEAFSTMN